MARPVMKRPRAMETYPGHNVIPVKAVAGRGRAGSLRPACMDARLRGHDASVGGLWRRPHHVTIFDARHPSHAVIPAKAGIHAALDVGNGAGRGCAGSLRPACVDARLRGHDASVGGLWRRPHHVALADARHPSHGVIAAKAGIHAALDVGNVAGRGRAGSLRPACVDARLRGHDASVGGLSRHPHHVTLADARHPSHGVIAAKAGIHAALRVVSTSVGNAPCSGT